MRDRLDELLIILATSASLALLSWWKPGSTYQLILLSFAFLYACFTFGINFAPKANLIRSSLLGFLTVGSSLSLLLTLAYYLGISQNDATSGYALALAIMGWQTYLFLKKPATTYQDEPAKPPRPPILFLSLALVSGLCLAIFLVKGLIETGTVVAIRTPWPELIDGFIPALSALGLIGCILSLLQKQGRSASLILSLCLILFGAIAPRVYQLGYGFDGFIHRASEAVLEQTGTLNPKPPYYIGIYTWNVWVKQITGLSLALIDTWMNVILLAFIPFVVYWAAKRSNAWLAPASLLALAPLSAFVGSTPQTTAYILGFIGLGLAIGHVPDEDQVHLSALAVAAWSVAVHPLAGLPFFCITVASLFINKPEPKAWRWIGCVLAILAGLLSVPAAFYLNSRNPGASIQWNPAVFFESKTYINGLGSIFMPPLNHTSLLADGASIVGFFSLWLVLAFALISLRDERRKEWLSLIITGSGLLLVGFFLKSLGEFTFLIDYERGNYADRLSLIGWLIWLIPASIGFHLSLQKAWNSNRFVWPFICLSLFAWQAGQIYIAYPRHDAAIVGRGWSVGKADFEAVRYIDQDASGQVYTVLANQSVSAAAMESYGFKRYANDVFYYPIPTGGPLYELFLSAVGNQPDKETINEAAQLGQSKLVYVVLNDYWWNAEQVKEKLSAIADKSQSFSDGATTVFRFDVSTSSNAVK